MIYKRLKNRAEVERKIEESDWNGREYPKNRKGGFYITVGAPLTTLLKTELSSMLPQTHA